MPCDGSAPMPQYTARTTTATKLATAAMPMALLVAATATGCGLLVSPTYRTALERAGRGELRITETPAPAPGPNSLLDPTANPAAVNDIVPTRRLFPIRTAVYHAGRSAQGRPLLEFGLYAEIDDLDRPANNTQHYLCVPLVLDDQTGGVRDINPDRLVMLARPSRDRTAVYRYARLLSVLSFTGQIGQTITGRLRLEMAYITALPAGDGRPIIVEVEFTAVPDLDLLRRMRLAFDGDIRKLEDVHLNRTARPTEDLDLLPAPRPRR